MPRPGRHPDPRTEKAVEIVLQDPTKTVPWAMQAAGFSEQESQDRNKQMWIRRRIPTKRSLKAGNQPPTPAATISTHNQLNDEDQTTAAEAPAPELALADESDESFIQFSEAVGCAKVNFAAEDPFECELQAWISFNRGCLERQLDTPVDASSARRKYMEQTVQILHSLAGQIICGSGNGNDGCDILQCGKIKLVPDLIAVHNVVVCDPAPMIDLDDCGHLSAHFVRCGSDSPSVHAQVDEDKTQYKYAALHAFARIAYAMCMMENGSSLPEYNVTSSEVNVSIALSLQDDSRAGGIVDEEDEILEIMRKSYRATKSESNNYGKFMAAMIDAGIPLPMRRFISDLMGDEHGGIFRSEHSFTSFEDVLSDLKQMVDNPEVFLHGSASDSWKLDFGEKLYGRDAELQALMDAADRVVRIGDDPSGGRVAKPVKTEVIMVSGNPGAGKSRLVRSGGAQMEKQGWCFLQCKFDRVVHPEPLSILAHAFDEYFGRFTQCLKQSPQFGTDSSDSFSGLDYSHIQRTQQLHDRLSSLISTEGLGILSMYIPSLRRLLDLPMPVVISDVNETLIASLLGALLLAISSKDTPIILLLDDLQWADPLSLSLLMSLLKGTYSGSLLLTSSSTEESVGVRNEENTYIMYVVSFREHAVNDDQSLANALQKLQNNDSINVTTISLPGMAAETLNDLLSDTLGMPKRRVRPLSELVMYKTEGLPLFVIEFIRALRVDNLLTHSFIRGWEWDSDSIEIFPISESVAELFALKLHKLSNDALLGLQIVSCFGTQVEQHVLNLLQNYDGENSVDIPAAINVALNEGLVERAANFISFSHDLIQKATVDSICKDDPVPLLRKLISALVIGASASNSLDSVLFVVVDLINRVGCHLVYCERERTLFAELNLRAGSKALAVPDFAAAAMYAENGIALLSDICWETQYDLSLRLYETSVLAYFSNNTDDQEKLISRINTVFERARNFTDKFNTHRTWTQLLAMKQLPAAIEQCLVALELLGEPLDLSNIDYIGACEELLNHDERFSGASEGLLSTPATDSNKKMAMTTMSSLIFYYNQRKSFLGAVVSCRMIEMSVNFGYSADSIYGAAAFAVSLVTCLGDIDCAHSWGRKAMALMNLCGKPSLIPIITASLFGFVFVWKVPFQSTLEFLAEGIRSSFMYGYVEYAKAFTQMYISRSFVIGKNIGILDEEVNALTRQHGIRFGHDTSPDALNQFVLLPMSNILHDLMDNAVRPRMEMQFLNEVLTVDNYDLLKVAIENGNLSLLYSVTLLQTAMEFMCRDMDKALKCTNMYYEHFGSKKLQMTYIYIYNVLFDGLINFHFAGKTGETRYQERGENALSQLKEWLRHSDWNFQNKFLMLSAEYYRIKNDTANAARCYDASIKAAKEHKFIHEEAMANELAGMFHLELGSRQRAYPYFKQSLVCYQKWGAPVIARRIDATIEKEFEMDAMQNISARDIGIGEFDSVANGSRRAARADGFDLPLPLSIQHHCNI